jgi:hypothetical protein
MTDLSVIVPTYREAENLPELVARIDRAVRQAEIETEIIVVDDNSPDETRAVCAELSERFPLRLFVRTAERGLASAVVAGFAEASGDVLLCLDADLSHPPEKIPELYAALTENSEESADFVMGSRYVPGGGTDEDWGWFRQLNSRVATWLARPLTRVSDPMAGFFALKRETFLKADELDPVGFKIALELIVKCDCRNVAEGPDPIPRPQTRREQTQPPRTNQLPSALETALRLPLEEPGLVRALRLRGLDGVLRGPCAVLSPNENPLGQSCRGDRHRRGDDLELPAEPHGHLRRHAAKTLALAVPDVLRELLAGGDI